MAKKIINWNSAATLFDRLAVEVVKQIQFEERKETAKVELQERIRSELRMELGLMMNQIINEGKYEVEEEIRTFS